MSSFHAENCVALPLAWLMHVMYMCMCLSTCFSRIYDYLWKITLPNLLPVIIYKQTRRLNMFMFYHGINLHHAGIDIPCNTGTQHFSKRAQYIVEPLIKGPTRDNNINYFVLYMCCSAQCIPRSHSLPTRWILYRKQPNEW